ncbi:AGC protein kinase [Puccinia sorghi]|uniref:AGC protein kinase n=1 Tax=Puccinia sorghi TaxID=27349 RepID=A0A0L6UU39_9BASI|nr:AGC protein kinase [Puccinia sorghi]
MNSYMGFHHFTTRRRIRCLIGLSQIMIFPQIEFMNRLMCMDPKSRLGAQGAAEVKAHLFLADIDWAQKRGITCPLVFHDKEENPAHPVAGKPSTTTPTCPTKTPLPAALGPLTILGHYFKNLPMLEQANEEVIRRLKVGKNGVRFRHPRHLPLRGKLSSNEQKIVGMVLLTESNSSSVPLSSKPLAAGHGSPHSRQTLEQFSWMVLPGKLDDPSRRNSLPSRMCWVSFSGNTEASPPVPALPTTTGKQQPISNRSHSHTGSVLQSHVKLSPCPGLTASLPGPLENNVELLLG